MLVKIYPENPQERVVDQVVEVLQNDGLIIYPTGGIYAFGCSLNSPRAVERLKVIKNKSINEFAIMCSDLSHISDFAKVSTPSFKILRRNLPGPFTFILPSSSKVPSKVLEKRKTIGVRMTDNGIPNIIIERLESPLLSSSVRDEDDVVEYTTDPGLIFKKWGNLVDLVIDGGYGDNVATTLVDLTGSEPVILREGRGELIF